MIYSADACLIFAPANISTRDAVVAQLPAKLDAAVWAGEYSVQSGMSMDGNPQVAIGIRFAEKPDRDALIAKARATNVWSKCLPGSFVRAHICHHDETPPRSCETETVWSK